MTLIGGGGGGGLERSSCKGGPRAPEEVKVLRELRSKGLGSGREFKLGTVSGGKRGWFSVNGLAVVEEGEDRIGEERERFKEGLWFGAGEEKVMMEVD